MNEWLSAARAPPRFVQFLFFRTKDETKTKYMRRNTIKNTDTTLLLQWNFCSLSWMWERWVKFKFIGHYIIGGECRLDYCWKDQEVRFHEGNKGVVHEGSKDVSGVIYAYFMSDICEFCLYILAKSIALYLCLLLQYYITSFIISTHLIVLNLS